MRLKTLYSGLILAAIVILASCNAVDTPVTNTNNSNSGNTAVASPTNYPDGARQITTSELETLMKEGKAYLVDVRFEDAYNMGHIPGSHLIPAGQILDHVNKLPRDKMIVTYCS